MKKMKNILIVAGLALASVSAFAQGRGFDVFGGTRTILLDPPASHLATYSSLPVDTHGFNGISKLDLIVMTNSAITGQAAVSITAAIQQSPDQTNWTGVTYSLAVANTQYLTNYTYSAGSTNYILATNYYVLPYTITTPTSSTAGFATPYGAPVLYNTTNALTFSAPGCQSIGFNISDAQRYLRVVWTEGATSTNYAAGAILTGYKQTGPP